MVKIQPFGVEEWMDEHETQAKLNIAESCCAPVSITELCRLSEADQDPKSLFDLDRLQDYGNIRGLPELRSNLAALYSVRVPTRFPPDNVLIVQGAIAANYLSLYTLVGPGDHVICHHPTYQQLYTVPASIGAEVDLWKATPQKEWAPDIEELKRLIKPNTKLIIINSPNNPTGAILKRTLLQELVIVASKHDITILSDEVYRPIFHGIGPGEADFPPSILSLGYENTIATGSLSKAYSLAGIRVGWVASRSRSIIERVASARHYTTLSVSQLDQRIAAFALSSATLNPLLSRNIALAKSNLAILSGFVERNKRFCEWVKPVAGTTAFVRFDRYGDPVDSVEFCSRLLEKTGVLFVPGEKGFGAEWKGYVRIGFACSKKVLEEGLKAVEEFIRCKEFKTVPAHEALEG